MSLNDNKGCSKTTQKGQFNYEEYHSCIYKKNCIQWDYRDFNGVLHSGIASCLEKAIKQAEYLSGEKIDITL